MACLEGREEMTAIPEDAEMAIDEGIVVMPSWGPYSVIKDRSTANKKNLKSEARSVFKKTVMACGTTFKIIAAFAVASTPAPTTHPT